MGLVWRGWEVSCHAINASIVRWKKMGEKSAVSRSFFFPRKFRFESLNTVIVKIVVGGRKGGRVGVIVVIKTIAFPTEEGGPVELKQSAGWWWQRTISFWH